MQKNLIIVESPAKAKTIEKFLGKDYKVMSSYGHIRDLQKKDLGIDMQHGFKPIYEIPDDKKKLVDELRKEAKKVDTVWLASDEDREGEAISWHLYEALGLQKKDTKRIAFHEITKNAVLNAIENPREIDQNLVDAQQARRVLDRIVGFELSPILWRKIKPALSAGRVQSVAVRLIVEREREIDAFKSEAAYRVIAVFNKDNSEIRAELTERLKTKEEAVEFLEKLKGATFIIEKVEKKPTKRSPAAPFTTSTLQQEASRKLGFPVGLTMSVAQKLYESGKISYMRTDSVNLSTLAINAAKAEIIQTYGDEYVKIRQYSTKTKGAQEAHEAIRPTFMSEHTVSGTAQEKKLYDLIWKRTIASQMADAELERTNIIIGISNDKRNLVATGEVVKFPGFLNVYLEGSDDDDDDKDKKEEGLLPAVKVKEQLQMETITATERFTQRPSRYSEASLVRKLEELGIGRPSTYAPTISTIQNREYVEKKSLEGESRQYNILTLAKGKISDTNKKEITGADKNRLIPTDIGTIVNDYLTETFPQILEYNFTAKVEDDLDYVAEGKTKWNDLIGDFYKLFHPSVEKALNTHDEHKVGERVLGVDSKTGRQISVKIGRFGPMVQIGSSEGEEKPEFAGLLKDQSIATITLEEALKLFELPRKLGLFEDKIVTAAVGRFGPYVKHDNKFVSLPKDLDPYTVTLEEAVSLIETKRTADLEKVIKIFDADTDLQLLNGRFGPYIAYKKKNYKIPKGKEPKDLTFEECMAIIESDTSKKSKAEAKSTKATKGAAKTKTSKAKGK